MIYNYMSIDRPEDWPSEKKVLIMQLLDIKIFSEEEIGKIEVTPEYLTSVETRLTDALRSAEDFDNYFNVNGLSKHDKNLLIESTNLIKDLLSDDRTGRNAVAIKYLYNFLQGLDNIPESKYILAYMAKTSSFIAPDEFIFDADRQFIFEGILFSALNLYNSGGANKDKISESHKRFVKDIERKKEEKLGRTQKLIAINEQALKELGYSEITCENRVEYIEKLAEIDARKGILNEGN